MTLPELSPTAIYESAKTCSPGEKNISRKGGGLLVRFIKRIQGSHEILLYYIQQHRSFTTNSAYHNDCCRRKSVLAMKTVPAPDRTPLRRVAVKLAIMSTSLARSPRASSSRHRRCGLRSSDSCSLEPPSTARDFPGTAYSRLALF